MEDGYARSAETFIASKANPLSVIKTIRRYNRVIIFPSLGVVDHGAAC
jgi:hypothetical protein